MTDKKKIIITVISQHEETATQQFSGELYVKGQSIYMKYVEVIEQQEIRHLIRYSPNELKITRHGLVESEQVYRAQESRIGSFSNHMISLNVEAVTKRLVLTDLHNNTLLGLPTKLPFQLSFDYELYVDGQSTGSFSINMTIKEGDV